MNDVSLIVFTIGHLGFVDYLIFNCNFRSNNNRTLLSLICKPEVLFGPKLVYSRHTDTILMSIIVGAYTHKLINRLSVPDLIIDITIGPVNF